VDADVVQAVADPVRCIPGEERDDRSRQRALSGTVQNIAVDGESARNSEKRMRRRLTVA
jgi:hypothetical protein